MADEHDRLGSHGPEVGEVGLGVVEQLAALDEVAPDALFDLRGQSREFRESASGAALMMTLALMFIYLVLSAQFESFIDPLIIMIAVPLGLTGVIAILFLTGTTINIQSLMGTLMMIGVVVNNSILLVEFANQLRQRGYSVHEAALAAAHVRLRPVLMTAMVAALGFVPMALNTGMGAEVQRPLATVVIGGVMSAWF